MQLEDRITLREDITALHLHCAHEGEPPAGSLSPLPLGATVCICGHGFNTRTVMVTWQGEMYFVFLQDIQRFVADEIE